MEKPKSPSLFRLAFTLFPARIIVGTIMMLMSIAIIIGGDVIPDFPFMPIYLILGLPFWYLVFVTGLLMVLVVVARTIYVKRKYFDNP